MRGTVTSEEQGALPEPSPLLIVLSGPSGVGKDAVLHRMRELGEPLHFAVTATSRPQRPGEKDGIDYHFIAEARFQGGVSEGEFLEWAQVYGNWYGVPKEEVRGALHQGSDVIVKVDVQGAATIKGLAPQGVFIFLAAPNMEELVQRLRLRKTESGTDLTRRIETAWAEMQCIPMFDYVVVNHRGRVDEAVAQIDAIITAEKCRVSPRRIK